METVISNKITASQIDSLAYMLKDRLMTRFNKVYGANLMTRDIDRLSFVDIILAGDPSDPLDLYAEIKSITDHGLNNEQKDFLYKLFPFFSGPDPDFDFDNIIGQWECSIERDGKAKTSPGGRTIMDNGTYVAYATYYRHPLSILRVQRLGDDVLQAILAKSSSILVLEVVDSVDKLEMS
ncbi:MAG: hypothetical protein J6T72_02030 [Alphaproteobacteria bacterium]|nr:hypothetical protein [Alphaproteobacteria bacterium]